MQTRGVFLEKHNWKNRIICFMFLNSVEPEIINKNRCFHIFLHIGAHWWAMLCELLLLWLVQNICRCYLHGTLCNLGGQGPFARAKTYRENRFCALGTIAKFDCIMLALGVSKNFSLTSHISDFVLTWLWKS